MNAKQKANAIVNKAFEGSPKHYLHNSEQIQCLKDEITKAINAAYRKGRVNNRVSNSNTGNLPK